MIICDKNKKLALTPLLKLPLFRMTKFVLLCYPFTQSPESEKKIQLI